jgi:hypothetical protein
MGISGVGLFLFPPIISILFLDVASLFATVEIVDNFGRICRKRLADWAVKIALSSTAALSAALVRRLK